MASRVTPLWIKSLLSRFSTGGLTAQATPIAAAQIAAGVSPDQAAINAANAVVDATPPGNIFNPTYPQVMQWRVMWLDPIGDMADSKTFQNKTEADDLVNSRMQAGSAKVILSQLTPSGSVSQPPTETVILTWPLQQGPINEPLTVQPPVNTETAAAVAEAMKPLDSFYTQNQAYFEQLGYTSAKWASLSVNQKSEAIRQAVSVEAGPIQATTTPQYVASRPAETVVVPSSVQPTSNQQQEAAAMAQIDAFYSQNQGFFTQNGYGADRWAAMSLGQKSDVINAATSGTLTNAAPVASKTPAPATTDTVAVAYDLYVEGVAAGSFAKLEDAVAAAVAATTPGDRFEVLYNKQTTGLRIRTTTGSVDVPADIDPQVRLMSRDKVGQFVVDAETKTAATGGGVPWWMIVGGGAAAAIASRFL